MPQDQPGLPPGTAAARSAETALPVLELRSWELLFSDEARGALNALLAEFLPKRRWFGAKARPIESVGVLDLVRMLEPSSFVLIVRVAYESGEPDRYLVPLALARGEHADQMLQNAGYVLARVRGPEGDAGVLYESVIEKSFAGELLNLLTLGRQVGGEHGELAAWNTESLERIRERARTLEPRVSKAEQSNTSILYGDAFILKLYRRLETGINPDVEVGAYLTRSGFPHTPPVAGAIEYRAGNSRMTAAALQGFVANQGDAWEYTLAEVKAFGERVGASEAPGIFWLDLASQSPPPEVRESIGPYLDSAALLGRRTAEMHSVLAAPTDDPEFAPEPLTFAYRRVLAERIEAQARAAISLVRNRMKDLPDAAREDAFRVLEAEHRVYARCAALAQTDVTALRTRHHGDYHLGQVLWTGSDFVIIDFEGEPLRPLRERRMKRSPLRDVAGMLRSFDYAAQTVLPGKTGAAAFWSSWVSARFVGAYLETAGDAAFVPRTRPELETLLAAYLIEKATYEVMYELNNRPAWTGIPLRGILQLIR